MRDSPPDWALPGAPRSYTVTDAPCSARAYAVERPTIPAPITATSTPAATFLDYPHSAAKATRRPLPSSAADEFDERGFADE
jgi:hypothetical protein